MVGGRETQLRDQWVQGRDRQDPQGSGGLTGLREKLPWQDPLGHPYNCQCTEGACCSETGFCGMSEGCPSSHPGTSWGHFSQSLDLLVPGTWREIWGFPLASPAPSVGQLPGVPLASASQGLSSTWPPVPGPLGRPSLSSPASSEPRAWSF